MLCDFCRRAAVRHAVRFGRIERESSKCLVNVTALIAARATSDQSAPSYMDSTMAHRSHSLKLLYTDLGGVAQVVRATVS